MNDNRFEPPSISQAIAFVERELNDLIDSVPNKLRSRMLGSTLRDIEEVRKLISDLKELRYRMTGELRL